MWKQDVVQVSEHKVKRIWYEVYYKFMKLDAKLEACK